MVVWSLPAQTSRSESGGAQATWRQALGAEVIGVPAAQAGSVAVVCDDGTLRTFSSRGAPLWTYDAGARLGPYLSRSREGTSYIGRRDGALVAVNRSGRELWRRDLGKPLVAPVLVGWDGRLFVAQETSLSCFTAAGFPLWRREFPEVSRLGPVPDGRGGAAMVCGSARLFLVDQFGTVSGQELAAEPTALAPYPREAPAIAVVVAYVDGRVELRDRSGLLQSLGTMPDRPVAVAVRDGQVAAVGKNGTVSLLTPDAPLPLWNGAGPAAGGRGTALLFDERGVYALAESGAAGFSVDGRRLWSLRVRGAATAPAFSDDGLVFSGGTDWILYAYRVEDRVRATKTALYGPLPEGSYGLGRPGDSSWATDPFALEENTVLLRLQAVAEAIEKREVGEREPDFIASLMEIAGSERFNVLPRTRPAVLPHLRVRATTLLANLGSRETIPFLADLFIRDREILVQTAAAAAIGRIGVDPEGLALAAFSRRILPPGASRDERLLTALAAATGALCRFSGPPLSEAGIALLVRLSADDQPTPVRRQALAEIAALR